MDRLRTFGIVAHIDAGKTTLTERILHDSGAQPYVGSVDDGTAAMDWMPLERSRGISITAAATRVTWNSCRLQVVDTPGHVDFVAEVERCLHVLDGVVVIVDGVRGIESQTETVWRQAEARGLPRMVFVNKMDRTGADFEAVIAQLVERFECTAAALVVPLYDDNGAFAGIGHAVTGAVQWFDGQPAPERLADLRSRAQQAHERLVEIAADIDDAVFADVVRNQVIAPGRLLAVLRRGAIERTFTPVLAGAALWNRGVDWLLDAVVDLMPSPVDVESTGVWSLDRAGDPAAPLCGLVFKVQHEDTTWNFVRVIRGQLTVGEPYLGTRSPSPFVLSDLWVMHGDRHRSVAVAGPGEIVVVPGRFGLRTGDTLYDPRQPENLPIPKFPSPVLAVTFEPDHGKNGARLLAALRELAGDDPTLRVDLHHGEITVRGMGELHLDVVGDVLRSKIDFGFDRSKPRVARRETVVHSARGEIEVRAVVAGNACSARCEVRVEPAPSGDGDSYLPATVSAEVGGLAANLADEELRARVSSGLRVGPMVGLRVVLLKLEATAPDGGVVEGLAQQAAARALEVAVESAGLVVLQPVVQFEVTCPEDGCAAVLADLGARGAEVTSVASGRLGARVQGRAELAQMLGYVTRLRSITKGRGEAWLRPAGFTPELMP